MIELRVPDASYEKHLAEILSKKLPKITAVFAYENYPVFNTNSDIYAESEHGAYVAYGIDKKWHGLMFRTSEEFEAFIKGRNFIYFINCKELRVHSSSRNIKEKASLYAKAATAFLEQKYAVENEKNITEPVLKSIAVKVANDFVENKNSGKSMFEAGLYRKKYLENYLQGSGTVKIYASLEIEGTVDVKMPNITKAKEYFREHPDKLIALLLEQNALKVDMRSFRMRESNQ